MGTFGIFRHVKERKRRVREQALEMKGKVKRGKTRARLKKPTASMKKGLGEGGSIGGKRVNFHVKTGKEEKGERWGSPNNDIHSQNAHEVETGGIGRAKTKDKAQLRTK